MTDIKQIAITCANRIFDRMELCRGSAMLKSDIEREVEMALQEHIAIFQHDATQDWVMREMRRNADKFVDPPLIVASDPVTGEVRTFAYEDLDLKPGGICFVEDDPVIKITEDDIAEAASDPMEETQRYKKWLDERSSYYPNPKHARLVLLAFFNKLHREYMKSKYQLPEEAA